MAVRPCGSLHLRDATFLAKTTSYRLHRDRNEALRQEPAKQANSNKTDYFRIKQRNLSVARLEGREEAVGNERCVNCSGTGKCDCTYCGGIGRANYTDTNVLPAGQYPVWCKECGGSGLSYCVRCQGTGNNIFQQGIGFRLPHEITNQ
ncbi:hypothetical protein HKI87_14g76090 [Chloropicon roscoffensis]|uniref:Uncharacterized protein n=1 Tax=Chloropicon roscoffensis TaxID=1461544 RepID=A0AAX4PJL8_9CHLO